MRIYLSILLFILINTSCDRNKSETKIIEHQKIDASFFPVGDFLLGEIELLKQKGISPKLYRVKYEKSDSSYLDIQTIESNLSDFLLPKIDSIGLSTWVEETKFFDETIELFTLSYDVQNAFFKNTVWRKWDVYINPETQKVERVFLVKNITDTTIAQLTWIPKSFAKMVFINNKNSTIVEEKTIIWSY